MPPPPAGGAAASCFSPPLPDGASDGALGAVPHGDQPGEVVHETVVTLDVRTVLEGLREDEVQVAVLGVAEHDGIVVAALPQQVLQLGDSLGQGLDGKHDVFDDERRPAATHGAHGGDQPLAHRP